MSVSIIQINQNDDIHEVIRKANTNFSAVANIAQETSTTTIVTDDKNEAIAKQLYAFQNTLTQLQSWVQNKINNIEDDIQDIDQRINNLVPPTGTYVMSDYDPNNQYPNTEWEKILPAPLENIDTWHRTA